MSHITLLSDRPTLRKTVAPCGAADYSQGLLVTTHLKGVGTGAIELDRAEVLAVLRILPTDLLTQVLGERGLLLIVDRDDTPEAPATLDALAARAAEAMRHVPGDYRLARGILDLGSASPEDVIHRLRGRCDETGCLICGAAGQSAAVEG